MDKATHTPPDEVRNIYSWYKKAQVDYTDLYIKLYISYNAWYQQVTQTNNDREALSLLKKRFIIWDDYCKGQVMPHMFLFMERIVEYTTKAPLMNQSIWDGRVTNTEDWKSLIEYWYQIRCRLVHGSEVPARHVWLAYETLDIFMGEIVNRMHSCFTDKDLERLKEVTTLSKTEIGKNERFRRLQQKLYAKYIDSPDIWQVDMQRVQTP